MPVEQPSAWVARFAPLIPIGEVLDLACGNGRHARLLANLGLEVRAIDRDDAALAATAGPSIVTQKIDLEAEGFIWPFEPRRFSGIVVTNYLHRPLFPHILEGLQPGGVLIYETFAQGNGHFGKPSNPAFLLKPGELLHAVVVAKNLSLRIVAYEDGYVELPKPAMVQRICVVNTSPDLPAKNLRLT